MADVSVRAALPGDAPDIGRIQIDTWRAGYGRLLPAEVLDALSAEHAQAAWSDAVREPPTSKHRVLVAVEQSQVVGFAACGPDDDPEEGDPDPDTTLALSPLLVEPRWGRRGHGSRLLAAAVDHARVDGMTRAITWLPEGDTASHTFFTSAGWAPDGFTRGLDTGAGELREVRLRVLLGD